MFPDLLPSWPHRPLASLRPQSCQRLRRHGNADEVPTEAGKGHLSLLSARKHSLTFISVPQSLLNGSSGHWLLVWQASSKPQRRKEVKVGGTFQATISHTEGVVGSVGTSSTFSDPP